MGSMEEFNDLKPWIETPLVESAALSKAAGCRIFLKLENLQPSGSFKSRGIGNLIRQSLLNHPTPHLTHFYSSSGGNAGLACVAAAVSLNRPATVIVPLSTKPSMIAKIRAAGATDVIQHGASWKEADGYLREQILKNDPIAMYVPPFDHADVWAGNSTIVEEVARQIPDERPDAIVCSVGGGGLFNGVMLGVEKQRWTGMNVLAVETKGADSLATSLQEGQLATLDQITSVATSLAAKQVSRKTYELAQREGVKSVVLSDAEAAMGCWRLADDERLMVELACGVSVAVCYDGRLKKLLPGLTKESKVVIVLCGGSNVSLEMLVEYRHQYGSVEKVATKSKSVPSTFTAPPAGHVKGAEVVNMDEMMRTCEGAAGEHLPDMATIMQVAREFDS